VTNDVIIKESDDTYVVLENGDNFVKAARTLTEKAKVLLERYEDITAVKTVKDELNIGEFYYLQLAELAKEVGTTAEVIGQQKDAIETSLPLQSHMTKILQTLDTKLDSLDKELDRFFEPEEISPVSIPEPKQKSNHERTHATRTEHKSEFSTILDRVLLDHRYAKFISERFHSRAQFEAQLRREVERIEAPSKFDILLGVRHPSTFSFLVDRTIEEIVAFDHAPRVVIRGELAAKDIPYEIYVEWMYILGDIQSVLQAPAHITFGELFVRAELEVMLIEQIDTDA
jgi:hypothetical protein